MVLQLLKVEKGIMAIAVMTDLLGLMVDTAVMVAVEEVLARTGAMLIQQPLLGGLVAPDIFHMADIGLAVAPVAEILDQCTV